MWGDMQEMVSWQHNTLRYCSISGMYGEAAADALDGSSGSQAAARFG